MPTECLTSNVLLLGSSDGVSYVLHLCSTDRMPIVFVPLTECLTSNVLRLCSSECLTSYVLRLCSTVRMPYVFVPPTGCLTSNVLRLCSSDGVSYAFCLTPLFHWHNVLMLCSTDRMSYILCLYSTDRMSYVFVPPTECLTSLFHRQNVLHLMFYVFVPLSRLCSTDKLFTSFVLKTQLTLLTNLGRLWSGPHSETLEKLIQSALHWPCSGGSAEVTGAR